MSVPPRRRRFWLWGAIGVVSLTVYFLFFWRPPGRQYDPSPMSFNGISESLRHSVVVPSLDSPVPPGKSAIWCASFQLAWNRLKTDVVRGPVRLKNAEGVAEQLNHGKQLESDLDPRDVYAAAGLVKDGIVERIQADMARKFPDLPAPSLDAQDGGAVAYAYMAGQVKFTIPFFDNDDELLFTSSTGEMVAVKSFGIREKDVGAFDHLRKQVQVLYASDEIFREDNEDAAYVVDPCKDSDPYQIILACINRKPTLGAALADVDKKMAQFAGKHRSAFGSGGTLLIPMMHWRVSHRFKELEGRDKEFLNPALNDLFLATALQTIQFRLDRSGAELASESKDFFPKKSAHAFYGFNRPFLVIMKKRGGRHPFFVMWVDNAELLQK